MANDVKERDGIDRLSFPFSLFNTLNYQKLGQRPDRKSRFSYERRFTTARKYLREKADPSHFVELYTAIAGFQKGRYVVLLIEDLVKLLLIGRKKHNTVKHCSKNVQTFFKSHCVMSSSCAL